MGIEHMKLILFAKHLSGFEIDDLVKQAKASGVDGFDFPLRHGYAVNPENFESALPRLVRAMEDEGMSIPMCTGETKPQLVDPDDPKSEAILGAMSASGVRILKMGYVGFEPLQDNYRETLERTRRLIQGWEKLAKKHGVTVVYHTHSGYYMGCTAAGVLDLIEGFDPNYIGAYLDAGHLSVAGERFPVACSIVHDYLKVVAIKSMVKTKELQDGRTRIQHHASPIDEGYLEPDRIFAHLRDIGFSGPVSVHVEYAGTQQELIDGAIRDVKILRDAMTASENM